MVSFFSQLSLWTHEIIAVVLLVMILRLSYAIFTVYQQKKRLKGAAPLGDDCAVSLEEHKDSLVDWSQRFFYVSFIFLFLGLTLSGFIGRGHDHILVLSFCLIWLVWLGLTRIRHYNHKNLQRSLWMLAGMILLFFMILLNGLG